jgi:hypothetical protein
MSSQVTMSDESIKKAVRKGLKIKLPTILNGVIGRPQPKKSGQAIRLIKSWTSKKLQDQRYNF